MIWDCEKFHKVKEGADLTTLRPNIFFKSTLSAQIFFSKLGRFPTKTLSIFSSLKKKEGGDIIGKTFNRNRSAAKWRLYPD